jgi:uncharacterized protein YfaS (alpha-2-macroglobulin family)
MFLFFGVCDRPILKKYSRSLKTSGGMMSRFFMRLTQLVIAFCLLMACSDEQSHSGETAAPVPAATEEVVKMVTAGVISPQSKIEIHFTGAYFNAGLVDKALTENPLQFTPAIDGVLRVSARDKISFTPNVDLPLAQEYTATLKLSELFPSQPGLTDFSFAFATSAMEVRSYKGEFFAPNIEQPERLVFRAEIAFIQAVEAEVLAGAMQLTLDEARLNYRLEANEDGMRFTLVSDPVERLDKNRQVKLLIEAAPLQLEKDFSRQETLPAMNYLIVSDFKVIPSSRTPLIQLSFSDMLAQQGDLSGIITIGDISDLKFSQSGKTLRISGPFVFGQDYQLTVRPGIRSVLGTTLADEFKETLSFPFAKPEVRFASRGTFLPTSARGQIHVKTVNLKYIVVSVQKIFANNVGQFLQEQEFRSAVDASNGVSGWELQRVGLEVYSEKIDLSAVENTVLTTALDLSAILPDNPGGIYYLEVSFDREAMIYPGLDDEENQNYRYYGDDYYNNPLRQGYIYRHGQIYKTVILSDLGLSVVSEDNGYFCAVTDLQTAQPLSGVTVQLMSYQNQVLASAVSDDKGFVNLPQEDKNAAYVEASKGAMRSIVRLYDMAWNLSTFDIGGADPGSVDGFRAYLFTERGVHRPGDTIHVNLIARNRQMTFPANLPVSVKLINPRNALIHEQTYTNGRNGFFHFPLKTAATDPTGTYYFEVTIGSQTFHKYLQVETVIPDRIKLEIIPDQDPLALNEKFLQAELKAKYLFGNPASGLQADVDVVLIPGQKRFAMWEEFIFTPQYSRLEDYRSTIFSGPLNSQGKVRLKWQLPERQQLPVGVLALLAAEVKEKGGRGVRQMERIAIETHPAYTGIIAPDLPWNSAKVDHEITYNYILVDAQGEAIGGKPLSLRIYRNSYFWWWEYNSRDEYQLHYKKDAYTELVEERELVSTSTPGQFSYTPEERGNYLIELGAKNGAGSTISHFFYASAWGGTGGKDAGMLALTSDAPEYYPGMTAYVNVPTAADARVLFTVMRGGELLERRWLDGRAGEVQVPLKITAAMVPNVYAGVAVIQPHGQTANDRPLRMFGVIPLNVADPLARQELNIDVAESLRSDEQFTVKVQTGDKQATTMIIAIVDEGLLTLTNFQTPNPDAFFNQKQRLTGRFFDLFNHVLGSHRGDVFKTIAIGGGFESSMNADREATQNRRFKPVVMFSGPQVTDSKGRLSKTFTMPDYFGAVRIMAISAQDKRFGSSSTTVPVKTELMLMPTMPRILGPGERFRLPITVFAMDEKVGETEVELNITGTASLIGKSKQKLTFSGRGNSDIFFDVAAADAIGEATFRFSARSGDFRYEKEIPLYVRANSPRISDTKRASVAPGTSVTLPLQASGIAGSNQYSMTISRLAKLDFGNRLRWLLRYPYGCLEQTVSTVMPQLYLANFLPPNLRRQQALDDRINAGIRRLRRFQLNDGHFSYWPGATRVNHWADLNAGHFLLLAKERGYRVGEDMLAAWLAATRKKAIAALGSHMERSYRLYLLALAGKAEMGAMNLIRENSYDQLPYISKRLLATAYLLAGNESIARQMWQGAEFSIFNYRFSDRTFGSDLRDLGLDLNLAITFADWTSAKDLYQRVTERLAQNSWYSTQTLGICLLGLGQYVEAKTAEFEDAAIRGSILVDGQQVTAIEQGNVSQTYDLPESGKKEVSVRLDSGSGPDSVYLSLYWSGIPLRPENKEISENLQVITQFYDDNGVLLDPKVLKQGKTLWLKITAKRDRRDNNHLRELALSQLIPSGWEIVYTRLSGSAPVPEWYDTYRVKRTLFEAEHMDMRDDRVMWFFDLGRSNNQAIFFVKLSAVTVGDFALPPTSFEAMYDNKYLARAPGQQVQVVAP